jgi:hypothetical protein
MGNLVTLPDHAPRGGDTILQRAQRYQAEADSLVRQETLGLLTDIEAMAQRCMQMQQISAVPAGVRDALRRLGEDMQGRHDSILCILARR